MALAHSALPPVGRGAEHRVRSAAAAAVRKTCEPCHRHRSDGRLVHRGGGRLLVDVRAAGARALLRGSPLDDVAERILEGRPFLRSRSARDGDDADRDARRDAHPRLFDRVHGGRARLLAVLPLAEPVRLLDVAAGDGQQLRRDVLRLGRSGPVQLRAHRVLVQRRREGEGRAEGVRGEPVRRLRIRHRPVHPLLVAVRRLERAVALRARARPRGADVGRSRGTSAGVAGWSDARPDRRVP